MLKAKNTINKFILLKNDEVLSNKMDILPNNKRLIWAEEYLQSFGVKPPKVITLEFLRELEQLEKDRSSLYPKLHKINNIQLDLYVFTMSSDGIAVTLAASKEEAIQQILDEAKSYLYLNNRYLMGPFEREMKIAYGRDSEWERLIPHVKSLDCGCMRLLDNEPDDKKLEYVRNLLERSKLEIVNTTARYSIFYSS